MKLFSKKRSANESEKIIQALRLENENLHTDLNNAVNNSKKLEADLRDQMIKLNAENELLIKQNVDLKASVSSAESNARSNEEYDRLNEKVCTLENENGELIANLAKSNEEISHLSKTVKALNESKEQLADSLNELREEKAHLESTLESNGKSADEKLAALTLEYTELVRSLNDRISQLSDENAKLKIDDVSQIDRLRSELAALQEKNEQTAILIGNLQAENNALHEKLTDAENTQDNDKVLKYDRISTQIGDIILSSKNTAAQIIADANARASQIISESENDAEDIRKGVARFKDDAIESVFSNIHTASAGCIDEIVSSMRSMQDGLSALLADFERKSTMLDQLISTYEAKASHSVDTALESLRGRSAHTESQTPLLFTRTAPNSNTNNTPTGTTATTAAEPAPTATEQNNGTRPSFHIRHGFYNIR